MSDYYWALTIVLVVAACVCCVYFAKRIQAVKDPCVCKASQALEGAGISWSDAFEVGSKLAAFNQLFEIVWQNPPESEKIILGGCQDFREKDAFQKFMRMDVSFEAKIWVALYD